MSSPRSSRRRIRVVRRLRAAHDSLCAWDSSLRLACAEARLSEAEIASLLAVFQDAKRNLNHRLGELGEVPGPAAVALPARKIVAAPHAAERACRACGRALGAAFREAQAVADAATAGIVYGPLRALEKQLWFLEAV